jgi:hypothetical protein
LSAGDKRDENPVPALALLGSWLTFGVSAWYFGSHRPEHPSGGFLHYFKSFNGVVYPNDGEHRFMMVMQGVIAIVTLGAIALSFWKRFITPIL